MAHTDNESNRSRRIKGAIAGLAGACLLLGGTFALWSDSDSLSGGTIINGNLDVSEAGSPVEYWDISPDRADAHGNAPVTEERGHAIADLNAWNMVPGDTVQGTYLYRVSLEGDNLVADLSATVAGDSEASKVQLTAQAYVWDLDIRNWKPVGDPVALGSDANPVSVKIARVQAANQFDGMPDQENGVDLPVLGSAPHELDGTGANVAVVVRATLPDSIEGQDGVTAPTMLDTVTLRAEQVRH